MRLILLILGLIGAMSAAYAVWGPSLERALSPEASAEIVRGWGAWAWLVAIALLVSDVILPIPTVPVMAGTGIVYGLWAGGAIASIGSILAGLAAYGLARLAGDRGARFILGTRDLPRLKRFYDRGGVWLIALCRWLPILPEMTCALAGLAAMPMRRFLPALVCGSVPMGFAYAALGAIASGKPILAMAAAIVVPALSWPLVQRITAAKQDGSRHEPTWPRSRPCDRVRY